MFDKKGYKTLSLCRTLPLITSIFFFSNSVLAAEAETENAKPLESINLQLQWIHQFQFAGYYAAKDQGFYAEEGLDVHIHPYDMEKIVVDQVITGESEYAVGDVGILFEYAKNKPIKALAAVFQHNPLVFITKQSSGIFSTHDMLGKRIMQRASTTADAPLRAMLADAEISGDQYESVKNSFYFEDLISDNVDVVSGYITDQPYALRQRGVEINIFKPQDYGIDFYGDVLFTSDKELKFHPGRSERFLRASIKGWKYALGNSEEIIQLIKNQYESQSSIERLRNEAIETRKLILPDKIPLGQIKAERLRHVADVYSRLNLSRKLSDNELTEFIYPNKNKIDLNDQERAWIKQHPVIRLGIDENLAPYEWIDEQRRYRGITADYMALLEKRLGVTFEFIAKKSWDDVLDLTKRDELDMLSGAVKTEERNAYLNFSKPYLSSSAVIISEHSQGYIGSLKNLKGKRVAIQKGHYTQELLTKNFPEIDIISTDSIKDALQMVSEGQVHSYVGDVTAASYVMKKEGFLNLAFSGTTPYLSKFSIATDKNKPELASIMSKALASIDQKERDAIFSHWQSFKINQGINVKVVFKYALLIISLFIVFVYWIYRLRRSENALKASEAKLQLILDTEPECVKVLDAEGCLLQMNQAGLNIFDASDTKQVIGQNIDGWILEEHRQAFNEMKNRVLNGKSSTLEYQVKGLKGKVKWLDSHAVPLIDENTKSVSVLAVSRDITERKKTEQAEKLAALVYQNSSEAMMILDTENRIIAINPAFSKITGYSFEEVKGKNPKILQPGSYDETFYVDTWNTIEKTGNWEGELWNKRKNGDLYAERLIVNTIFTRDGKVAQRVALFSDITEKKETEKLIWIQANFDPLTQLPNRNMFMDRLEQDIKAAIRSEKLLALIYLDLDHFKEVNDTLGHDKGDALLCEAAKRLTTCMRDSDTVARLGGDEFIVILSDLDKTYNIDRVAQNIIQQLSQVYILGNKQAYVSASLGIALYPNDADNSEGLIKHADQAMYLSKELGRGRFSYFTKEMQEQAQYRMQLMNDLREALAAKQFELYYQPIIDLASGQIHKAEALIRWNHPIQGVVSPVDFIPLAENSGLIVEIGEWVFKEAAQQVKYWRDVYNKHLQVSVNKSPVQFWAATNRNDWLTYLNEIGLTGDGIGIEITESLLMDNADNITHQLLQYREAGVQVSMDDFGTGYSALSYLNKFDLDYLKIDRSFTRNIAIDSRDMALSEAIILMSHKLGLKVIAEGIETDEQRKLLISAGCDYGQGYFFSRPVPVKEFETLLNRRRRKVTNLPDLSL